MTDEPIKAAIRDLIASRGEDLRSVSRESGVSYWQVREWMCGRAKKLDADVAHRLARHVGVKGFSMEEVEP